MADAPLPAVAALVIGAVGLLACWLAMSNKLPVAPLRWWQHWKTPPPAPPTSRSATTPPPVPAPPRRRVVTGLAAADRHGPRTRPGRHLSFRPDVLRQQRHRLGLAESQRVVEHVLDDDPERLAGLIEHMLAEDRDDPTRQ